MKDEKEILIKKLRRGNMKSFTELYIKYSKKIYGLAIRYLKDRPEAEDVVQEVFLIVWKRRKFLKMDTSLNAYVFTISFNAIKKRFRKISREGFHIQLYKEDNPTYVSGNNEIDYNDLKILAENTFKNFSDQLKKIYLLSQDSGLSNEEIAKKLKISKKTVDNSISKAKQLLMDNIKNNQDR